jgi:hypothetical protein
MRLPSSAHRCSCRAPSHCASDPGLTSDERRPVQQLTVNILRTPAHIGGKVGPTPTTSGIARCGSKRPRSLQPRHPQPESLTPSPGTRSSLQGALFLGFVDTKAAHRTTSSRSRRRDLLSWASSWKSLRSPAWPAELPRDPLVVVGRQTRRARVYYDRRKVHGELAVAREVASYTTEACPPRRRRRRAHPGQRRVGPARRAPHRLLLTQC